MIHRIWLCILLCGFAEGLFAQLTIQPNYYIVNTDRGLQSNTIYNLHQGENGLLYLAHAKGLSSFDGRCFIHYYNHDLPYTETTNILESSEGKIYCQAFNNTLFELRKDSLFYWRGFRSNTGFRPVFMVKDALYGLDYDTLIIWNTKNQTTASYWKFANSSGIVEDLQLMFFIGDVRNNKLLMMDKKETFYLADLPQYHGFNFHQSGGQIFGAKNKKASAIVHVNTGEYFKLPGIDPQISVNFVRCTDSMIWICTTNGLYYRSKGKVGEVFQRMLPGFNITDVAEITSHGLAVSTLNKGLIIIPDVRVQSFEPSKAPISYLTGSGNTLLLGTEEGNSYSFDEANSSLVPFGGKENRPVEFIHVQDDLRVINSNHLSQIAVIKDATTFQQQVMIATSNGLFVYSRNSKPIPHWIQRFVDPSQHNRIGFRKLTISNEHTSTIKYDALHDKFYLNNYNGIFEIDSNRLKERKLAEPNCVLKDLCVFDGTLYLATKDKGLLLWNGTSYQTAFPTTPPPGILYKFLVTDSSLWVLGEDALFRYSNQRHWRYDDVLGMTPGDVRFFYCNQTTVFISDGKKVVFFPISLADQKQPQVDFILNQVSQGNQRIKDFAVLSHQQNRFQFSFSLVSFANASQSHIAYTINGSDLIHLASDARSVDLNFLKPDHYEIKFYTLLDAKSTPKLATVFHFQIKPAFYNTWWFYSLLAFLFLFLVYLFVRRRLGLMKKELVMKQSKMLLERELDKSTLTSIKAQMNPHFLFNALNTIQSYVYMNDKRNAGIYISKFSELTRHILDQSSKDQVSLQEELNSLNLYLELEKMRFEDILEYEIKVDSRINKELQKLPSMLLQPYVENAIKHGLFHKKQHRVLLIHFKKIPQGIRIEIDDNGIGRKRSEELNQNRKRNHQSFSMGANKKRLDILKQYYQDIHFEIIDKYSPLNEPLGTTIVIELPDN